MEFCPIDVLGFSTQFKLGIPLFQCILGYREILDLLFMQPFGFGQVIGLRLERLDAGGEIVKQMGFLVGACHCWMKGFFEEEQEEEEDYNGLISGLGAAF